MSDTNPTGNEEREIWRYLNDHPRVTYADIANACAASEWKRTNYLRDLRRKGILKPCGRDGSTQLFTVLDAEGAQAFAAKKRGVIEGAIWRAIRVLGEFTTKDLQIAVEAASPAKIQTYCSLLTKSNYLKVIERARPGKRPARYRLINDTGPLPPIQRQLAVVVDGNLDRIVFAPGARI